MVVECHDGAGAPKLLEDHLESREMEGVLKAYKPFQSINYSILKPIMAFGMDECNRKIKSPKGPDKDHRTKLTCKWNNDVLGV